MNVTDCAKTGAVALTFDDGPDEEFSPKVLEILKAYGVRATFFCLGRQVERFPSILERMAHDGHSIGNHSWDHPHLPTLSLDQIEWQLETTSDRIQAVTGHRPTLVRPPYGHVDETLSSLIDRMGYRTILWDVDSGDWQGLPGPHIAAVVIANLHPGAVVLQHTGAHAAGTVDALPYLLAVGQRMGFRFVPIESPDYMP